MLPAFFTSLSSTHVPHSELRILSSPFRPSVYDVRMKTLGERIPSGGIKDVDSILELFLSWCQDKGFDLYPAQEEALLEIMDDKHVVLNTPTGSGKSLVALGLHFRELCRGRRSFYTSPIKALASEKFFALCRDLGPEKVGMMTGDASINADAPVICCTAEILANLALREGEDLDCPAVVMDEFHYYADRDRGWAWQVPLITLPHTRFLLMSATLGDMSGIIRRIEADTDFSAALVSSAERPVPLEYSYHETPLHETVEKLTESGRAPIYIVNFTQRDCAELAQGLTSMSLTTKQQRKEIARNIGKTRFDTPYGREFRRFLSFGIGVHHAGLLPRYRLLVEQLAQQGLLHVVSGTDTLGVGVNIPIRTVLFTALAKYDGEKVRHLRVRDFQQIAGRAGRKGFDEQGWVVCQAPPEAIDRRKRASKAAKGGRKARPHRRREGEVSWSEETFKRLVHSPPEKLRSSFRLSNGMVLDLIQRDAALNDPERRNFQAIRDIIDACHEDGPARGRLLRRAAEIVRSLYRLGVINMVRDRSGAYMWAMVDEDLQVDFSLFHNLSLFLLEAIGGLDHEAAGFSLDLLSAVESVLEDPRVILRKQLDKAKTELITRLKAEGVPYEERMRQLDEVCYPEPLREYLGAVYARFRSEHPWVGDSLIAPKSIVREMYEDYLDFGQYIRRYGLQRSEGVLLRYLSQVYKTLDQNVPDQEKTEAVWDVLGWLRALIERVDTSLIQEWEGLRHPELKLEGIDDREMHRRLAIEELVENQALLRSRVRAEMRLLLRALASRDWEEAARCVRPLDEDPWPPERLEKVMDAYYARYEKLRFDHEARLAEHTIFARLSERQWKITQRLLDPEGDEAWWVEARVNLESQDALEGPLIRLKSISGEDTGSSR